MSSFHKEVFVPHIDPTLPPTNWGSDRKILLAIFICLYKLLMHQQPWHFLWHAQLFWCTYHFLGYQLSTTLTSLFDLLDFFYALIFFWKAALILLEHSLWCHWAFFWPTYFFLKYQLDATSIFTLMCLVFLPMNFNGLDTAWVSFFDLLKGFDTA